MRFSLSLSRSRKLARWVAWNIDGATLPDDNDDDSSSPGRAGLSFRTDPRNDDESQTLTAVYDDNRLDRGHIARRADLLWGDRTDAELANKDSFYLTNITHRWTTSISPGCSEFEDAWRMRCSSMSMTAKSTSV
jgi:endonuclease G